jgi:hypothetical protein
MKEKITRLRKHAIYFYAKNINFFREKRMKKQKERLQMELMSGSVKRVK